MSSVGSAELIFILIIGLIVLGPKRLPEIANKVGGWVGQARRMTRVMKRQLEDELNLNELKKSIDTPQLAGNPLDDAPAVDHIPKDDDTFSPQHKAQDEEEKTA